MPSIGMYRRGDKDDMCEERETFGKLGRLVFPIFIHGIFSHGLESDDVRILLLDGLHDRLSSERPGSMFRFTKIKIQRHDFHLSAPLGLPTPRQPYEHVSMIPVEPN